MSFYTRREPTADGQNANTNLDQDLHLSRETKYKKSEPELRKWIFSTLKIDALQQVQYEQRDYDLIEMLKDGELLCKLGDLVGVPNSPTRKYKNSRMPFVQMENILFFLLLCEMIGVSHDEIFQTVDLFDRKDPYQIVITLMAFSRQANELQPLKFLVIGPKVIKVKPQVPKKPLSLRK